MKSINSRGFTLIEVLVAVFILSVGLIALTGMQSTAIKSNSSAGKAEIAIQLAEEMIDRIRVNAKVTPEIYDGMDTSATCGGVGPVLADCNQWKSRLESSTTGLRGAVGRIDVQKNVPFSKVATIIVTVTWGSRSVRLTTMMETWLS